MIGTGLRARTSRQMSSPLRPGIMMSRISRSKLGCVVAELAIGVVPVLGEGDVEALLLEGIADRIAHRGLVVRDQDSAVGHRDHATGVAAVLATGSRTQKVLPAPTFDSTPISPSITSTIRFAIESPRPKPSCSSEPEPR